MDDYESKEKYGKIPSITFAKRIKWRVYIGSLHILLSSI